MPGKSRLPPRKRATATSSAAISAAVARGPSGPASRAMRSAGKRASSGARKSRRPRRRGPPRAAGERPAIGIGQRVLDRESHVGGAQLCLQRAVHELDGGVDDRLRMDHDVDRSYGNIVEPAGLDDLQALVGERRRVDGDLGAHRPGRVAERLLRRDRGEVARSGVSRNGPPDAVRIRRSTLVEVLARRGTARSPSARSRSGAASRAGSPAGRPATAARTAAASAARQRHDQVAAGDEGLLVRRGHDLAGLERGEDRAAG